MSISCPLLKISRILPMPHSNISEAAAYDTEESDMEKQWLD